MLGWHKKLTKRLRKRLGLTKYQFMWLSFVKGLVGNRVTRAIQDLERSVKGFITKGALFQELGFNYIGPVDGHDLPLLIECLTKIKEMKGPILFHCRTEKGKGLKEAEEDPQKYHGVSPKKIEKTDEEGDAIPAAKDQRLAPAARTFTEAFGDAVVEAAASEPRVVAITAAMPTGTGLTQFEAAYPERFFDVGICEQHAVTMAAGLAAQGMRPVAAIYSTFLQRGYDQLVHDVCLQNLPVIFAIDRAGLVGQDSPTHDGAFDVTFLRAIPNMTLLAPRDDVDTAGMLHWALTQPGPVAIRYARSNAPTVGSVARPSGTKGEILREGCDGTFLAVGAPVGACLAAAEGLAAEGYSLGVADARAIKPLDGGLLGALAGRPIITVEESALDGGFGSAVLEHFAGSGRLDGLQLHRVGLPCAFASHAQREEQLALLGLDADGLMRTARTFLAAPLPAPAK